MVSAASAWASPAFKLIRILIFWLSITASMGLTALYIFLLVHGWSSFILDQRVLLLILASIYGISSIMLYLMIVGLFPKPWIDGARAVFLALFQAGGTIAFFFLGHGLSCRGIGREWCKSIEDIAIFGGWSFSGLLLSYTFLLVIISCVPVPVPPHTPEAALAVNLSTNEILSAKENTTISVGSHHSRSFTGLATPSSIDRTQDPLISSAIIEPNYDRPGTPASVRSIMPPAFYPADGTPQTPFNANSDFNYNYQPRSFGSVRSISTSGLSTRSSTNPRYNYIYPSRVSSPASSIRSPSIPNEPISRQGTPMVPYEDPMLANGPYYQQHPRSLTPSSEYRGRSTPQPLAWSTYGPNVVAPPPLVQPFSGSIPLRSASPWIRSLHSGGSGYMSSQNGRGSLASQSPSPQNVPFNTPIPGIHTSAILPENQGLPVNPYDGSREVRQHSSMPDIDVNNSPTYANSHYQAASDRPPQYPYFAI